MSVGMHLFFFSLLGNYANLYAKKMVRDYLAVRVISLPPPPKVSATMKASSLSVVGDKSVSVGLSKVVKKSLVCEANVSFGLLHQDTGGIRQFVAEIPKKKYIKQKKMRIKASFKPLPVNPVAATKNFEAHIVYKKETKKTFKRVVKKKLLGRTPSGKTHKEQQRIPSKVARIPQKKLPFKPLPKRDSTATVNSSGSRQFRTVSIKKLRFVKKVVPKYPFVARQLGYEGVVKLSFIVDRDGRVCDVRLLKGSGRKVLDKAAISAVRKWRFSPISRSVRVVTSIVFRLED